MLPSFLMLCWSNLSLSPPPRGWSGECAGCATSQASYSLSTLKSFYNLYYESNILNIALYLEPTKYVVNEKRYTISIFEQNYVARFWSEFLSQDLYIVSLQSKSSCIMCKTWPRWSQNIFFLWISYKNIQSTFTHFTLLSLYKFFDKSGNIFCVFIL